MMMKPRYPGSNIIGLDIDEKIISIARKKSGNYFNTIIATIRLFGFRKQS